MSGNEKTLTDAYYWLSMYKSGAITEGVAMEKVKEAIFDQPQLNENQQIVLDWLKKQYFQGYGPAIIRTIHLLQRENSIDISGSKPITQAYRSLNTAGEALVVKMFTDWALEQEEE